MQTATLCRLALLQIFSKVVTAAAVAVTGDPNEFEKIAHSVCAATAKCTIVRDLRYLGLLFFPSAATRYVRIGVCGDWMLLERSGCPVSPLA